LRAVKEKGGLINPPFFDIIAAVIKGKLFSFSAFNYQSWANAPANPVF